MPYESEWLQRAILDFLQANLGGQLDAVETAWAGTDPITLPDPVSWHLGYKPTVLELPSTSFPFIAVMVPAREPQENQAGRWGFQDTRHQTGLHVFVVADDEETVNKIAHRYAEAIVRTFQTQRVIYGCQQRHWEPAVSLGVTQRHPKGGVTGDLFDDSDTDYIRIVQVSVDFEGG